MKVNVWHIVFLYIWSIFMLNVGKYTKIWILCVVFTLVGLLFFFWLGRGTSSCEWVYNIVGIYFLTLD